MNLQQAVAEVEALLLRFWTPKPTAAKVTITTWEPGEHVGFRIAEIDFTHTPQDNWQAGSTMFQSDPGCVVGIYWAERAVLARVVPLGVEDQVDADVGLIGFIYGSDAVHQLREENKL